MKRKKKYISPVLKVESSKALNFYNSGNLLQAKILYEKIVNRAPADHNSLQMLGIICLQTGDKLKAAEYLRRAVERAPGRPDYLFNLARTYHDLGKLDEAISSYEKCIKLAPRDHEVLHWLARGWHDKGEYGKAAGYYRQALQFSPQRIDTLNALGLACNALGDFDEAIKYYEQALNLNSNDFIVLNNLAVSFWQSNKLEQAVSCLQKTITLRPDYALAHYNMGNVLKDQKKLAEAVSGYRQAIALMPDFLDAHNNLGNVLKDLERFSEAETSYRKVLSLRPDALDTLVNLGMLLTSRGRYEDAEACLRQVINLNPGNTEAHMVLGVVLREQGRTDEAEACLRKAISMDQNISGAYNNLGSILKDLGKLDEAEASYRQALALSSDNPVTHSNLLLCMNYMPGYSLDQYLEEAQRYGLQISRQVGRKRFSEWSCSSDPKRLRVGMVSGDYGNHPVGYFLETLLKEIDQDKIDLIAYSTHTREDDLASRIRPSFSEWRNLSGESDEAAAGLIHEDGVHVLVDLSGHTLHNRLPIFAWKPAPVQATWLGYFASTGVAEIDCIIADPVSIPDYLEEKYTEKVWNIPDSRFCFSPPGIDAELEETPLPALRNGFITFGCFQNSAKLNDETLSSWGRILQGVPESKLLLINRMFNSPSMCDQFKQRLVRCGINPERVLLERPVPRIEYLGKYSLVDIMLDTYPFTGGTTTCEALWMGVPTITRAGNTMASRQGASFLTCVGLDDWITKNNNDYELATIAHSSDLEKLSRLRSKLRGKVISSTLLDANQFARNLESSFWGMWEHFKDDKKNS